MADRRVLLDTASFLDASEARGLGVDIEAVRAVVHRFLTVCYVDLGAAPRLLDGGDMERVLLELLPRHFGAGDALAAGAEEILAAYLDFLAEDQVVPNSFEQRHALATHAAEFGEIVASGLAQRGGLAASAAAPTVRHQADKTGRNDPCPCGSGRKFKKCCMKLSGG